MTRVPSRERNINSNLIHVIRSVTADDGEQLNESTVLVEFGWIGV